MNKRRLYSLMVGLGVALAVALALVFGVFSPGTDRGAGPETGATTSTEDGESGPALEASVSDVDVAPEGASEVVAAVDEPAPGSGGGPVEGIKVHGHWVIEVRDPDGSLVSRQEFDNALGSNTPRRLSQILARELTPGVWRITLEAILSADHPCESALGIPALCIVAESTDVGTGNFFFKNLSVTSPDSGSNANKLVLSGTATAQKDGVIERVGTNQSRCASPATSPATCGTSGDASGFFGGGFTLTTLPSPEAVSAGQQIQVTVVISFS